MKKKDVFKVLFWVNILIILFIIGILVLMYKYKNICQISVAWDDWPDVCKSGSLLSYYGQNYSFVHNVFYVSVFISFILSIILIIKYIMVKSIKRIVILILILLLLGGMYYMSNKMEINTWNEISSEYHLR